MIDMTYGELVDSLRKDLQLDATVDVLAGTILAALIDQNGRAAFPQLPSSQNRHLSFGFFSGAGVLSVSSGGVSVVRNSLGNYSVNNAKFPAAFVPLAVATDSGSGAAVANINGVGAGTFGVMTFVSSTAANVDTAVCFVAIY